MSQHNTEGRISVYAENIGGISQCDVTFESGVTVLRGRNATGRTSLLNGLAGVLGGTAPTLKGDEQEGEVRLEFNGTTYNQQYTRKDGTVQTAGQPVTERSDLVDLFVCLTAENPARRAIVQDGNLRDVIMRSVDTDSIQRRIEELQSERNRIGQRIRAIESDLEQRTTVTSRKTTLEGELEECDQEIDELRNQLEQFDADPEEAEKVEEALTSLEERKQELESITNRIRTQEDTREALRDEQSELQTERESIETSEEELKRIETRLSELTSRERSLATTINDLSAIVDFNEDLVSNADSDLLRSGEAAESPVSKLNPMSETVECWTCGTQVERNQIAGRLDELRDLVDEKRTERTEVQTEIEKLRESQQELQEVIDRRDEIEQRLDEISSEIAQRDQALDSLREEREDVHQRLSELEEFVSEREALQESELTEQYQQLSELEYRRGQLEEELSSVREELAELDRLENERDQLQAQQDEVQEELASQRTQIRDLEESAITAFNDHMEEILDVLRYKNIARVWIERKEGAEFNSSHGGYRGGSATKFELHVVRETDEGHGYEDTVQSLSESEREVVGLVVALAGYLVHDVHEIVPMMLLDSLEAIDAERIAALVDYFADYATYLVVALLPEDADALGDDQAAVVSANFASEE
ncbi:archaea-specific SMC-related protein [Halorhabdus rudnickae]|uniref:archaea-specific SMC-related protein n=1 Tax=Halorhabdus rudnickae TaxID=1775544 RepID=UPI00108363B8|nr:archaea-specific SMC-related protein [Halorhabdus rudnickae]